MRYATVVLALIGCGPAVTTGTPVPPAPAATASPTAAPSAEPATPPANRWRVPASGKLLTRDDQPPPTGTAWESASAATVWGLPSGCSARRTSAWLRIACPFGTTEDAPTFNAFGNGAWEVTWTADSLALTLPIGPALSTAITVGIGDGLFVKLHWRPKTSAPDVLGWANGGGAPECGGELTTVSGDPARHHDLEDCRRAGHEDCDALVQCLQNMPSHRPACPEGWVFEGECVLHCSAATDCGPGWTCEKGPAAAPVCTPPS